MREIKIGAIYDHNGIPVKALKKVPVNGVTKYTGVPVVDCLGNKTKVCVGSLKRASSEKIAAYVNAVRSIRKTR